MDPGRGVDRRREEGTGGEKERWAAQPGARSRRETGRDGERGASKGGAISQMCKGGEDERLPAGGGFTRDRRGPSPRRVELGRRRGQGDGAEHAAIRRSTDLRGGGQVLQPS